ESAIFPGRMAPNTALSIAILGVALLLIDGRPWRVKVSQSFSFVAATIGFVALVGYAFEVEGLYQFGSFQRISPTTAGCIFIISIATLLVRPKEGIVSILLSSTQAGKFARRMTSAAF